jgi:hypothetical protein
MQPSDWKKFQQVQICSLLIGRNFRRFKIGSLLIGRNFSRSKIPSLLIARHFGWSRYLAFYNLQIEGDSFL